MSKGVLIFAYNSKLDYVIIASLAAKLVKKHLGLPVTLVTDTDQVDITIFDNVIVQPRIGQSFERIFKFGNSTEKIQWHNGNRSSAYDLSPYDQTLLLDADYLMFNDSLKYLFDTDLDFSCYDQVHDISGSGALQRGAHVGNPGIRMQWATAVYFTKSPLAAGVFSMMQSIKDNYDYYATLYNFTPELFRNDYTMSIALQALTGYSGTNFSAIPGALITANTGMEIVEARTNGEIVFSWQHSDQPTKITKIKNTNIHIMNKKNITDPDVIAQLWRLT
jgi:hypothetical protein